MAYVKCPFCLNMHDISSTSHFQCPECKEYLPGDYVQSYDEMPPVWLIMAGFSRHGKTTYLSALTVMLEDVSKVWHRTYSMYLDDATRQAVLRMRKEVEEGLITPKTKQEEISRPLLMHMIDVPQSGSHTFVMLDVAGENYVSTEYIDRYVPFMKQVNTIWFFVSPKDLQKDPEHRALPELFQVYKAGMDRLHVNLAGKNLLVIYTKADEYTSSLPPEIEEYLDGDPYRKLNLPQFNPAEAPSFSLPDYFTKMQEISNGLRDYTIRQIPQGARFVPMVERNQMNLYFCMTSALGVPPDPHLGKIQVINSERLRVLDPFLWSLLLKGEERQQSYAVVASRYIEAATVNNLWALLAKHGESRIYYLGDSRPLTKPENGHSIPSGRKARPHLIGPILEMSPPGTKVAVLTDTLILDLEDFINTEWEKRLLLVMIGDREPLNWPHFLYYQPHHDPDRLVETLLTLQ